jgi:hypothetical protein
MSSAVDLESPPGATSPIADLDVLREGFIRAVPRSLLDEAVCVALINSLAEGFGNSTSDIDLMVIVSPAGGDTEYWTQVFSDGLRFDLYVLDEALVRARLHPRDRVPEWLRSLDFVHKVRKARPMIGTDRWEALVRGFSWTEFDQAVVDMHMADAHLLLEDVVGSVRENDLLSAALNARSLAEVGFDAYLASRGETQPRAKWRVKKARRALGADSDLLRTFVRLTLGDSHADERLAGERVTDCLAWLRHLQLLTFFPGVVEDLTHANGDASCFRAAAYSMCTRLDTDFIIHAPKPVLRCPASDALLWLMAPSAQSLDHLAELHAMHVPAASRRSAAELDRRLEHFVVKDLLHRTGFAPTAGFSG